MKRQNIRKEIVTQNEDFTIYKWYDDFGEEHNQIIYSKLQLMTSHDDRDKVIAYNEVEIEVVSGPFGSFTYRSFWKDGHLVFMD